MAGPVKIAILADGSRANRELRATAGAATSMGSKFKKAGRVAALGLLAAGAGAVALGNKLVDAGERAGTSNARIRQVATSMKLYGKETGRVADRLVKLAEKTALATGVDQNAIKATQAKLLTFKELAQSADRVGGQFDRATQAAIDLAATGFGSAESNAASLGKALNDPIKGLTALTRQGVTFTEVEKERITALVDSGRVGKAQVKILSAIETQVGGTAKATANGTDRMKVAFSQLAERAGAKLTPFVDKLADKLPAMLDRGVEVAEDLRDAVAPAVSALRDAFSGLLPDATSAGDILDDKVIPAVRDLSEVVATAVRFVDGLPGPVKDLGVQAAIAALVLPRLAAGAALVTTSARTMAAQVGTAAARTALLGRVARQTAGIAGLVALTESTQESNKTLAALEKTAGGVALGFAVGGPLGAAIGGTAGALWGAWEAGKANRGSLMVLSDTLRAAVKPAESYAASLDQITGAATRLTREMVLREAQEAGILTSVHKLGVNTRDVIGAVLGQEGATRRLTTAMHANSEALKPDESIALNAWLRNNTQAFSDQARQVRETNSALVPWKKALKGLPPEVRVKVKQIGADISRAQLRRLKKQYDLSPKQVQTIIRAIGTEATVKKVKGVWRVMEDGKRIKPGTNKWADLFLADVGRAEKGSQRGTRDILQALSTGTKGARADLASWRQSIRDATDKAREDGRTGSESVGAAMKAGIQAGFSGTAEALAAQARAAVRAAIAAGRAEGKVQSPSKETYYTGAMLGQGLIDGLAARKAGARKGGRDIVRSLLGGVTAGSSGVDNALSKLTALIEKRIKGKGEEKRQRAILRGLKDEYKALRANGRAQDKNTRKLEAATAKYKQLVAAGRQYAKTIKDGFVSYGSVVGLGVREGSSAVSLTGLLSQLEARAAASERFALLIKQLRGAGANQTTIQQLLDAGVEGGLATAEAIASGGSAAITQINQLTSQIAATGSRLGEAMRKAYKQAGIAAAQATVQGLKKRQRQLDRVAERMAAALAKQLRKELGLKAPTASTERIGARDTYARTPALDAYNRGVSAAPQKQTVRLRLSAAEVSQFARGKEVVADIDVYFKAGGTTKTIVKRGTTG